MVFTAIVLLLFEATKRALVSKVLIKYFQHGKPYIALVGLALLFSFLSGTMSVQGIKQYYEKQIVQPPTLTNIDSIILAYQERIKEIEGQKLGFKNSVSWKGKINIYDKMTANTLKNFDNQIASLQVEQTSAVERNQASNKQLLDTHYQETSINTDYFVFFALANELFIYLVPLFHSFSTSIALCKKRKYIVIIPRNISCQKETCMKLLRRVSNRHNTTLVLSLKIKRK